MVWAAMRHRPLLVVLLAPVVLAPVVLAPLAGPAAALEPPQAPPGYAASVQGSGIPGLDGGRLMLWNAPPTWDPNSTLRVDRHVPDGASGTPGHTYKGLWVVGTTGRDNRGYEWAITGEVANTTLGSTGAQHVAVNGTIFKKAGGAGEVGPSWGLNGNCVDEQPIADPTHSCIGAEVDVSSRHGGTDAHRQRVGLQISGGGAPGAHVGYGVLIGPTAGAVIDRAISLQPGGGSYGIGLDTTAATFARAPIVLGGGQAIALDGDPATGAFGHWIAWNGRFVGVFTGGAAPLQVHDDRVVVPRLIEAAPRVPASSTAPCEAGERAWDRDYEYRCVAPNRWRRAALADW